MGQWGEDSGLSTLGHYRMFSSVDSKRGGLFIADFRTDVRRASNRLVNQRPLEPALVGVSHYVEREVDRAEAEAAFGGYAADSREGNVAGAGDLVESIAPRTKTSSASLANAIPQWRVTSSRMPSMPITGVG